MEELDVTRLPRSIEAEQALIGALLANNKAYEKVSEFLRPEHFSDPIHVKVYEVMERLIQKGLRAKLITQSVLTGQMMIELGFYPNSPMILHGNTRFPEIPTLPSTIEELSKTFQDMPIRQTVTRINSLLEQMDRFMTLLNKDGPKIVADAGETVAVLSKTTKKADKVMDSFSENSRTMIDLNKMIKDFGYAAQSIRSWADYLERHPEALIRGKGGSR